MGIYDRDYYREDEKYGIHLSGARSMTTNLVIANVVVYVICIFTPAVTEYLTLRPRNLAEPWLWWHFISYGFAHSERDAWHLVGNMIGLWFFGRDVEKVWGRFELLRIYLVTVALGGIVWAARLYFSGMNVDAGLVGASGAVTAIVLLFVFKFPTRTILLMFFLPVPAWVIGLFIIINDVRGLAALMNGGMTEVAFDVHLVGAAFAALYYRFGWRLDFLTPRRISMPSFKRRPKLRVHVPAGEEDDDPEVFYDELDRRGDEVLAKLHREGEESLSEEERRILEAYSRRMQQKLR